MARVSKKILPIAVGISFFALAGCGGNSDESVVSVETSVSTSVRTHDVSEGGNQPGAAIGNTQRSWPDSFGNVIDAAHITPGEYSVDFFGRPVWTPVNHDGDLPKHSDLVEDPDAGVCVSDTPALDGKTQIQYVNGRYLVVNDKYGPSELNRGVPEGYSRHQFGAVLAAMNQAVYGIYAQGDEIGYELDEKLWSTSQTVANERAFFKQDELPPSDDDRAKMIPAAAGFRLVSCSDNVMTVEIVLGSKEFPETMVVGRFPMVWRGDNWKADFSGVADAQMRQPNARSLDGFSKVVYS